MSGSDPRAVTLIPGDGITRELVEPVLSVLEAAGAKLEYDWQEAGAECYARDGQTVPEATVASIRKHGVALKGKLLARASTAYASPNTELRRRLDLFALVNPIRNVPGLPARHRDVDILLVRESSEDVYAGLEHRIQEGLVITLKVVTAAASRRITRFALAQARAQGRQRVTLVHKANIMKLTDGLFIRMAQEVAESFPDIELCTLIVDNACMQLMLRPQQFEILLAGNLYGSILTDLGAGLVGGISASGGWACNDEIAVFEAVHGDAPQLEGTGRANPLPLLMPACHMLEHIGQGGAAARIRAAVSRVLARGIVTPDLGGRATTAEMAAAIASASGE